MKGREMTMWGRMNVKLASSIKRNGGAVRATNTHLSHSSMPARNTQIVHIRTKLFTHVPFNPKLTKPKR